MFFNTIETLIEHHNFKSANIQVAKDKNGLYAIVNLAPDLEKVTDEAMQAACSKPVVLRDTGEGFDITAEQVMQSVYEAIVSVDAFDASKLTSALTKPKTNAKTSCKSAAPAKVQPQPTTQAVSSFFDDNSEL